MRARSIVGAPSPLQRIGDGAGGAVALGAIIYALANPGAGYKLCDGFPFAPAASFPVQLTAAIGTDCALDNRALWNSSYGGPRCMVYAGGQYVAASTSGYIYSSPDGKVWTYKQSLYSNLGAAFSPMMIWYTAGRYYIACIAGSGTSQNVVSSADLVTWTKTGPYHGGSIDKVAQNGQCFVMGNRTGNSSGYQTFSYSNDGGLTWTAGTFNSAISAVTPLTGTTTKFIVVDGYNTAIVFDAADGSKVTLGYTANAPTAIATNGNGVIVATNGTAGNIQYSLNNSASAATWVTVPAASLSPPTTGAYIQGFAYIGGLFIAFGSAGWVATSYDGINWTNLTVPTAATTNGSTFASLLLVGNTLYLSDQQYGYTATVTLLLDAIVIPKLATMKNKQGATLYPYMRVA